MVYRASSRTVSIATEKPCLKKPKKENNSNNQLLVEGLERASGAKSATLPEGLSLGLSTHVRPLPLLKCYKI